MNSATFSMRPSRVLRKLRAGKTAFGTKSNLHDPRGLEVMCMYGFDCVWICQEHIPLDSERIEALARTTKVYDVDLMTRVKRGSYSDLVLPLEADSSGIMVPHIMNLQQAEEIVYYTRFQPVGRRPLDGGNTDGKYCQIPQEDYLAQANEQRFLCVQIEDPEPMNDLEAIAKLEGIDIIFFGPGDFSHAIGAPGQMDHPEVVAARKRVAEVATRYGKFAGTTASPQNAPELEAMGYRLLYLGADVLALCEYYQDLAETLGLDHGGEMRGYYQK
jgi:4-hydroxy-2-oxoheptanedioate aldolase